MKKMPHKIMPYVLPLASIIVILALFMFAKPAITGFFIAQQNTLLNAEIKITADEVLPEEAVISISILDESNNSLIEMEKLNIREFVKKYTIPLAYVRGKNQQLGYEGFGYTGNSKLNMTGIDLKNIEEGDYILKIDITYNETLVSSTEQKVEIK